MGCKTVEPVNTQVPVTITAVLTATSSLEFLTPTILPVQTEAPTAVIVLSPSRKAETVSQTMLTTQELCDQATAGVPLDLTYPDDTRLRPSERFTKTWRLVNTGTCPWTSAYSIEWFSGDFYPIVPSQPLENDVLPGESVDISVEMESPQTPGIYTSYWIIKNGEGELFGIGPESRSPFWVRIQVVAEEPTQTLPAKTATPENILLASGEVVLTNAQAFDLDTGLFSAEPQADITIQADESGTWWLIPMENNRMAVVSRLDGNVNPCQGVTMAEEGLNLSLLQSESVVCYLTGIGSWGFLSSRVRTQEEGEGVVLDYSTWQLP